jgi:hypothetical protein
MVDASTLEGRTRPANDGIDSIGARLRYYQWPTWAGSTDRAFWRQVSPDSLRLRRRQAASPPGERAG